METDQLWRDFLATGDPICYLKYCAAKSADPEQTG